MKDLKPIKDFRYKASMTVSELMDQYSAVGFQSINLAKAVEVIKNMKKDKAKVFLCFTSNMGSSGLRGLIAQLISMKFFDGLITTVGAIEEDFVKAHNKQFYVGDFNADDIKLGKEGINRIGNIFVPNEVYFSFEDIFKPVLNKMYETKKEWDPVEIVEELGKHVEDENSICYQAAKTNTPLYCPALMDGALGLQIYFFSQSHPDFKLNVIRDFSKLVSNTLDSEKTGVIVLGGGVAKHYALLANLLKDGMDYAVYISTASQHSGSLSGATTQEAKSWGKLKGDGKDATVHAEATIAFPLIMCKVLDDLNNESE